MRLTKSKKFKEDDGRKLKKQFLRDFKRGAKGITLVALVVTIVLNCCEAAMDRINRKSKIIEII